MPVKGFCEHGKVWTTCGICGKDVIATMAGKRGEVDDWGELRPKKKAVKPPPEEPPEAAADEPEAES